MANNFWCIFISGGVRTRVDDVLFFFFFFPLFPCNRQLLLIYVHLFEGYFSALIIIFFFAHKHVGTNDSRDDDLILGIAAGMPARQSTETVFFFFLRRRRIIRYLYIYTCILYCIPSSSYIYYYSSPVVPRPSPGKRVEYKRLMFSAEMIALFRLNSSLYLVYIYIYMSIWKVTIYFRSTL